MSYEIMVGLYVVPRPVADRGRPPSLPKFIEDILDENIERLAEAEHDRWMRKKLSDGWYWAPERRNEEKLHPALVPYDKLSEAYKEKDRNGIRTYKDILALVGFTISNKRA